MESSVSIEMLNRRIDRVNLWSVLGYGGKKTTKKAHHRICLECGHLSTSKLRTKTPCVSSQLHTCIHASCVAAISQTHNLFCGLNFNVTLLL